MLVIFMSNVQIFDVWYMQTLIVQIDTLMHGFHDLIKRFAHFMDVVNIAKNELYTSTVFS